jgi:hypothetical protein
LIETAAVIELPLPRGGALRVSCRKQGDQFAHMVGVGDSEVFRSVNEDRPTAWPISPPWQELHIHEEPGGQMVLLLVGRAGASHWSMSVSADEARRAIVFDVACRVRSRPEFLGSSYQLLSPQASAISYGTGGIQLTSAIEDIPAVVIQPLPIDGELSTLVELRDKLIVIRPGAVAQPPATIRWKYCVCFAD